MQKKFLTNLAFLFVINLLIKPLWIFGIDREVQNYLGADTYGLYFALFNFSFLFHVILDFGINNFNNIRIAKEPHLLNKHLSNILVLKAGLAFLYAMITFGIGWWVAFNSYQMFLLKFMVINQILRSLVLYLRSNISGLHYFRLDAILSVTDRLLLIVIIGSMLLGFVPVDYLTIERFVYAHTTALVLTAFLAFLLVASKIDQIDFSIDKEFLKTLLKRTYPFALLGILMALYNRIDSVMIERLLPNDGAQQAGIYAAAYRLLDAVNMFGFLFASLLLPIFANMLQKQQKIVDLLETSYRTIFVLASTVSCTCLIYRNEIMQLLYDEATNYWGSIFGLLILSFIPIASVYIFGTLLTSAERVWHLNAIAITGVILNIVLNFILIQYYKAFGATIATFITQGLVLILHLIATYRIFQLNINFRLIALFIIYFGVITGLAYLSKGLFIQWHFNFIVILLLSFIVALSMQLIRWDDLRKIIESREEYG